MIASAKLVTDFSKYLQHCQKINNWAARRGGQKINKFSYFTISMENEIKKIRIYMQGESSSQRRAFENARDDLTRNLAIEYPKINFIYESKTISQVVKLNLNEDLFVTWLTEGDGCVILCHPFQADFPPDWNYNYFLKRLRQLVDEKKIPIFPQLSNIEDPTFSQVRFVVQFFLNSYD